jgi:hypothetical protein
MCNGIGRLRLLGNSPRTNLAISEGSNASMAKARLPASSLRPIISERFSVSYRQHPRQASRAVCYDTALIGSLAISATVLGYLGIIIMPFSTRRHHHHPPFRPFAKGPRALFPLIRRAARSTVPQGSNARPPRSDAMFAAPKLFSSAN